MTYRISRGSQALSLGTGACGPGAIRSTRSGASVCADGERRRQSLRRVRQNARGGESGVGVISVIVSSTKSAKAVAFVMALAVAVSAVGVVCVAAGCSGRAVGRIEPDAEKTVLAALDRMVVAAEARDADALFSYVAENDSGAMVSGGQVFLTRTAALEQTRANLRGLASLKYHFSERLVTMLAPDAALVVVRGTSEGQTEGGRTFSVPFAQTIVMVRRGAEWRVLHSHLSSSSAR